MPAGPFGKVKTPVSAPFLMAAEIALVNWAFLNDAPKTCNAAGSNDLLVGTVISNDEAMKELQWYASRFMRGPAGRSQSAS